MPSLRHSKVPPQGDVVVAESSELGRINLGRVAASGIGIPEGIVSAGVKTESKFN